MKKILFLVLAITISGLTYSYSILESQSGNYIFNLDARTSAMGSAGVANGMHLFDSFMNPANLGLLPDKFGAQFGLSVVQDSDNRSLPMYNSFDAYSGDATYVSNVNYFNDYSTGAFYQYGFDKFTISAALAYRPFINFDSDYYEDVRNNFNSNNNSYPPTLAENYIESNGVINAISFITAFKYEDIATLGLEVSSLSGDAKWECKINWSDHSLAVIDTTITLMDYYSVLKRDFNGMQIKLGLNGKITDRLQAGFSYQPMIEFDVTGSINDSIDVEDAVYMYYSKTVWDSVNSNYYIVNTDSIMFSEYVLPSRMRLGISYTPQNIMKTYFNVDVEYVSWSEQNKLYDDQFNFFVGIEHILPNNIPIRLGFNYITSYGLHDHDGITFADKITMPTFSAGSGFNLLSKFAVDISLEYANRQYEALDMFMDSYYDYDDLWANPQYLNFVDRDWENPDTVKETLLQLKTSITYKW